ncbi:MAG: MATE family efflux transporter [Crenarchaeota archaeon]|nr:MATE family efflux transporter [Thermoproteota archaeon]
MPQSISALRDRIVEGPITKTLLWLAWPLIVSSLVNVSYSLIDAMWLGRLSSSAFSAVMVVFPVLAFIYSFGMGFSAAGTSIVSQYIGAREFKLAERSAGQFIAFTAILAACFSALSYSVAPWILAAMGVPHDVYPLAVAYMRTLSIGILLVFGGFAYVTISNAIGDTRTPTKLNIAGALTNIALDPVFIFGVGPIPRLGVVGAAIATIISRSPLTVIGLYRLFRGAYGFRIRLGDLRIERWWLRRAVSIGIPVSIQASINSLGFVVLTSIVSHFGTIVIASYGVATRLLNLISAFVNGVCQASATMIGQCLGASLEGRAKRVALRALALILLVSGSAAAFLSLFPQLAITAFIPNPEVVKVGSTLLHIFAPSIPFFSMLTLAGAVARGSGRTKIPAAIGVARIWGLRIPLAYALPRLGLGVVGVWLAMATSNYVAGLIALAWVLRGGWAKGRAAVPIPSIARGRAPISTSSKGD